jgi:enterochelin esterase-like enzyme
MRLLRANCPARPGKVIPLVAISLVGIMGVLSIALEGGLIAPALLGLEHLDLFSGFGFFSAAGGGGADFATRYAQLAADAKTANARINVLWIGCGTEDPLIKGAKTFDAELTRLQITHTYAERAGGHVWPIWRWALSEFAPQLFRKR